MVELMALETSMGLFMIVSGLGVLALIITLVIGSDDDKD